MKMMKGIPKVLLLVSLAMIFTLSVAGQVKAGTYTHFFGDYNMFNPPHAGEVAPSGTWATATFTDVTDVTGDYVQLTFDVANNLPSTFPNEQFMTEFYFNYTGDTSLLTFTPIDNADSVPIIQPDPPGPTPAGPPYTADGAGDFDILFDFPPPPGTFEDKFTRGEQVIYEITSSESVFSIQNFLTFQDEGTGNFGPLQAVAKLGGIICDDPTHPDYGDCQGTPPTTSAWAGSVVPEPVSSTLFLIGGTFLVGRRYLRRKK